MFQKKRKASRTALVDRIGPSNGLGVFVSARGFSNSMWIASTHPPHLQLKSTTFENVLIFLVGSARVTFFTSGTNTLLTAINR